MHVRRAAGCPTGLSAAGCNYVFALNPDCSRCAFIVMQINAFANGLAGAVVTDIVVNVIATQDISTFLFPNLFLYFGNARQCCVLGFHTYFFEPGSDPERLGDKLLKLDHTRPARANSLGLTAVSHEIAETYNDPFVVSEGGPQSDAVVAFPERKLPG